MVEGHPGYGKTTLARNIALDWGMKVKQLNPIADTEVSELWTGGFLNINFQMLNLGVNVKIFVGLIKCKIGLFNPI